MDMDQKAQSVPNVENYYFFLYIWTSYIASTPDWVTEFAEKQARQEQEDKIKVPVFGKYCWTNKFVTYCVCLFDCQFMYLPHVNV